MTPIIITTIITIVFTSNFCALACADPSQVPPKVRFLPVVSSHPTPTLSLALSNHSSSSRHRHDRYSHRCHCRIVVVVSSSSTDQGRKILTLKLNKLNLHTSHQDWSKPSHHVSLISYIQNICCFCVIKSLTRKCYNSTNEISRVDIGFNHLLPLAT